MNPGLSNPDEGMTVDELSNFVAEQLKRLNLVLKNLDGLNIVDIKFELQGGAYIQLNRKGLVINNGENDTFNVGIDGKAVLTGVRVQTKNGAYPNIDLSSDGNLLTASKSEAEFIAIIPDYTGSPTIRHKTASADATVSIINQTFSILSFLGNISVNAQSGNLLLSTLSTMGLSCNSLTMNGSTGYTGTFAAGTETVHVENGIIVDVT